MNVAENERKANIFIILFRIFNGKLNFENMELFWSPIKLYIVLRFDFFNCQNGFEIWKCTVWLKSDFSLALVYWYVVRGTPLPGKCKDIFLSQNVYNLKIDWFFCSILSE